MIEVPLYVMSEVPLFAMSETPRYLLREADGRVLLVHQSRPSLQSKQSIYVDMTATQPGYGNRKVVRNRR